MNQIRSENGTQAMASIAAATDLPTRLAPEVRTTEAGELWARANGS